MSAAEELRVDNTRDRGPAAADVLVRLRGVGVSYPGGRGLLSRNRPMVVAVDGVDLAIERGQTLGIVGGTGAGKSTVAKLVMGMAQPTRGTVEVLGHDLSRVDGPVLRDVERRRQVVLQDPFSSMNPRMRVHDIIAEPLNLGRRVNGRAAKERIRKRVEELFALVGLPAKRLDAFPHQFSGGQRQRISIARALAPEPELVVLDEPTSALDVSVRAQILNLLKELQERLGLTYLVISHDLLTVAYLSSTVAVMRNGRFVEMGPTAPLYLSPRHPYTVRLLASIPGETSGFLEQQNLEVGAPPEGTEFGCGYAARCELRTFLNQPDRCRDQDPGLHDVGADHVAACHFSDEVARFVVERHPSLVANVRSANAEPTRGEQQP